jgi:hypothetical protein
MRIRLTLGLLLLATVTACASHRGAAVKPLSIVHVVSAHHGLCPPASRRIYGERTAQLFASPLPYEASKCEGFPERVWLYGGCGLHHVNRRNTVFLTFARAQSVRFFQGSNNVTVLIRKLGAQWDDRAHREQLLIEPAVFKEHDPLPPGATPAPYREFYAGFGVQGDPLGLADGECPT